jgi:hypothetical protein
VSAVVCPNGHASAAADYCDTCGAPMGAAGPASASAASAPAAPASAAGLAQGGPAPTGGIQTCPNCQTANLADALFCEACGYDFTTGAMPRVAAPQGTAPQAGSSAAAPSVDPSGSLAPAVALEWVVEVWVDPDWYAVQESEEACPSPGLPVIVPLRVRSALVGRISRSRSIHPEVDCDGDLGVSRRQAQLTTDGTRWWIEDLQSSNGTYLGPDSGPLPSDPLPPGQRRELAEGDRIYVGAWTRLVVRRATDEEKAGGAVAG